MEKLSVVVGVKRNILNVRKGGVLLAVLLLAPRFAAAESVLSGFSVQGLVMQLSTFLPPAADGRAAVRQSGNAQASGVPQAPGNGQSGGTAQGAGLVSVDPALYLSADQAARLLPLLRSLERAPYPSPAEAREVVTGVDGILSPGQKDAWKRIQAERLKRAQERQAAGAPDFRALGTMSPEERRQFFSSLPPEQRSRLQGRSFSGGGSSSGGDRGAAGSRQRTSGNGGGRQFDPETLRTRMVGGMVQRLEALQRGEGGKP